MDARVLLGRLDSLKARRSNFDTLWQEVKDRAFPDGDDFTKQRAQGEKTTYEVYDSTAVTALERFAAVMESLLTPRQQRWHRLRSTDDELNEQTEVREWFDEVTRILFRVRESPLADFYGQAHEGYKSIGAYGNRCMYVYEDAMNGIRYRNCHIGQTWIALDAHRRVEAVYYTYKLAAGAALRHWGAKCPERVQKIAETKPFEQFEFLHAVQPSKGLEAGAAGDKGKPFASAEVWVDGSEMVSVGGYYEMPYIFSRYTVSSSEDYGRGPVMHVLPDVKTLNAQERTLLRVAEKIADPPLLLTDDGVFGWQGRDVTLAAGGLNFGGLGLQGEEKIKALQTGGRLDVTLEMMEKKRSNIHDALLVSLFQILVENPGMTATEVLHRAQEKGMLLAPAVGRQQSEMLGPMIEREVSILYRAGLLPPMPQALLEAEGEYKIEYESPATRYQRSEELMGLQRTMEVFAPVIQLQPSLIEGVKWEDALRAGLEINGVPSAWITSKEELEAIRAAAAEQAEEQDAVEQAPMAADVIKKLAEAGSKAGLRVA